MRCTHCDCKRTSTLRLDVHTTIILDGRVMSESLAGWWASHHLSKKEKPEFRLLWAHCCVARCCCRCTRCSAPSGISAPSLRCTLRMETLWLRYIFLYHISRGIWRVILFIFTEDKCLTGWQLIIVISWSCAPRSSAGSWSRASLGLKVMCWVALRR